MSDPYPITITRDAFFAAGAWLECMGAFDAVVPDGVLTIADVTAHVALLAGPLAIYEEWAVRKGVLPPIRIVAGHCGRASAGSWGIAAAGDFGVATAGAWGHATAGARGQAMVGAYGQATVGEWGTAAAGYRGCAAAGYRGAVQVDWYDGRVRTSVGYIGETLDRDGAVLKADVAYRVDDEGRFYRA